MPTATLPVWEGRGTAAHEQGNTPFGWPCSEPTAPGPGGTRSESKAAAQEMGIAEQRWPCGEPTGQDGEAVHGGSSAGLPLGGLQGPRPALPDPPKRNAGPGDANGLVATISAGSQPKRCHRKRVMQ